VRPARRKREPIIPTTPKLTKGILFPKYFWTAPEEYEQEF
jgi:hypothetical protein